MTKVCSKCLVEKDEFYFYKDKRYKNSLFSYCKSCCSERRRLKESPADRREDKLKRRYNITSEQFQKRLEEQNNLCALCGEAFGTIKSLSPCVDHDHAYEKRTGKIYIRGIIHDVCNRLIGCAGDNTEFLCKAVTYLKENQPKMTIYDPPSGHRYGFPKQYLPLPGETLEDTLRRDHYPDKEIEQGMAKWVRFWEEPDESTPTS